MDPLVSARRIGFRDPSPPAPSPLQERGSQKQKCEDIASKCPQFPVESVRILQPVANTGIIFHRHLSMGSGLIGVTLGARFIAPLLGAITALGAAAAWCAVAAYYRDPCQKHTKISTTPRDRAPQPHPLTREGSQNQKSAEAPSKPAKFPVRSEQTLHVLLSRPKAQWSGMVASSSRPNPTRTQ